MQFSSALPCLLLLTATAFGCATSGALRGPESEPDPRSPKVFDGTEGKPVAWSELVELAAHADVVVLGENHGHPLGLACAAALWSDLLERSPKAALALEFFERDQQSRLDDYLAGIADAATFEKRAERSAGSYPPGHRAMVEAAKNAQRPVYASNAPRAYVRLARTDGYERLRGLTPEQLRLFRVPDTLSTGRYRQDFDEIMSPGGHGGGGSPAPQEDPAAVRKRLDDTFRSQSLWDWTMAESIARARDKGAVPVVQVVGRFHCDFEGGLVQALKKLRPGVRVVVVSFAGSWSEALAEDDRARGDYVVYVGPEPQGER